MPAHDAITLPCAHCGQKSVKIGHVSWSWFCSGPNRLRSFLERRPVVIKEYPALCAMAWLFFSAPAAADVWLDGAPFGASLMTRIAPKPKQAGERRFGH